MTAATFGKVKNTAVIVSAVCFVIAGYVVSFSGSAESIVATLVFAGIGAYIISVIAHYFQRSELTAGFMTYAQDVYDGVHVSEGPPLAGPLILQGTISVGSDSRVLCTLHNGSRVQVANVSVRREMSRFHTTPSQTEFGLRYIVLTVDIGIPTPHIFIDGRSQNHFGRRRTDLWSLTKRLGNAEKLQDMEGDFYKFFDVYSADKDYLSAFTIVTPDAMLALRDNGSSFDYEIHDGYLHVIHETSFKDKAEYEHCFEALTSCLDELVPQIARHTYADAGVPLSLGHTRLNIWAMIYSGRIVLGGIAKLAIFSIVSVVAGSAVGSLF